MPLEEILKLIEEIKRLEAISGQDSFRRNKGMEELLEQFERILDALFSVEEDENNIHEFAELYKDNQVSAEAISEILFGLGLSEAPVRDRIEKWLEVNDRRGYLMFVGNISSRQNIRGQLLSLKRYDDYVKQRMEYVRKVVRDRYKTKADDSPFCGRGVVYTVITGGYDKLHEPLFVNHDLDYICFTDDKSVRSDVWKIQYLDDDMGLDKVRLQRYHKFFPYDLLDQYDYSIYVDGKNQITGDLVEYIEYYSRKSGMLCFPHPLRESLYQEIDEVAKLGKANANEMKKQVDHYFELGYDNSVPIIESCLLVRSHNDEALRQVMNDWWIELNSWTHRDQLSFGYVCWKNNYQFDLCELNIYDNLYIKEIGHLKKR